MQNAWALGGLGAQVARHVERVPNDNLRAVMFANYPQQRFCVLAAVGPKERHDRLGGDVHRVGDGDTDIETEQAAPVCALG